MAPVKLHSSPDIHITAVKIGYRTRLTQTGRHTARQTCIIFSRQGRLHVIHDLICCNSNKTSSITANNVAQVVPKYKMSAKINHLLSYLCTHTRTMDLEIFGHFRPPPEQMPIFNALKCRRDRHKI